MPGTQKPGRKLFQGRQGQYQGQESVREGALGCHLSLSKPFSRLGPQLLPCLSSPFSGSQQRSVHSEFPCSSPKKATAWHPNIGTAVREARSSRSIKWKGVCEATVLTWQPSCLPLGGRPHLQSTPPHPPRPHFPLAFLCLLATCCYANLPTIGLYPSVFYHVIHKHYKVCLDHSWPHSWACSPFPCCLRLVSTALFSVWLGLAALAYRFSVFHQDWL